MNIAQMLLQSSKYSHTLNWNPYLCVLHAVYDFSTDLFFMCIYYFPSFSFFQIMSFFFTNFSTQSPSTNTKTNFPSLLPSLPISMLLPAIGHSLDFRAYFLHLPQDWPYLMRALRGSRGFKNLFLSPSFPYLLLSLNCSVIWGLSQ